MTPNKSASRIGAVSFPNGNETTLVIGANRNTGATILWQRTKYASGAYGRWSRTTGGRRLAILARELDEAIREGARWIDRNDAALDALAAYL